MLSLSAAAQEAADNKLFPYPEIPESKVTLTERCNHYVHHFWDRCNLKQSFSTLARLDESFSDWVSLMPYATVDTVMPAIDKFMTSVAKLGPNQLLEVGKIAEKHLFSDSAEIYSDQLYIPIIKHIVAHKRVPKANKARYESQIQIYESSAVGKRVPNLELMLANGNKMNLDEVVASRVILFINDPDCFDCTLAKARLSADYNLRNLVEGNLVKVVSLYPGTPSEEWLAMAESYPEDWIVAANPDVDMYFDISKMPNIFYLDGRHKVLARNVEIDNLLQAVHSINTQMNVPAPEEPKAQSEEAADAETVTPSAE